MKWKCVKHNVEWDVSKSDPKFPAECPWCLWEQNDRLRKHNAELIEHRNLLVSAIDLAAVVRDTANPALKLDATKGTP